MDVVKERQYIQNLRTSGTEAPNSAITNDIHPGELIVSYNEVFSKLFTKKIKKVDEVTGEIEWEFEQFPGLSEQLNAELATMKALCDLNNRIKALETSDYTNIIITALANIEPFVGYI